MELILVNEQDEVVGSMEKMAVHQNALLHRAFSIFIFNDQGEMLLQQRALEKYHSGGLWTNACCSHPTAGKTDMFQMAGKRLEEEMGFTVPLKKAFHFIYKTSFGNGLTEHEFDHVFVGNYNGPVHPDPAEVQDYQYLPMNTIREFLKIHPAKFTEWFKIAFPKLEEYLAKG